VAGRSETVRIAAAPLRAAYPGSVTLTDLMPSLRRSIPDPLDPRRWPARTSATLDDVVVEGVSLERLVGWCGTPCVHTCEVGAVVVARVETVETRPDGSLDVWVDAELHHCTAFLAEARLIGRVSTAADRRVALRPAVDPVPETMLPGDVRAGDLVVVPCADAVRLRDLER